jgi:hypothetical protein
VAAGSVVVGVVSEDSVEVVASAVAVAEVVSDA